MQADARDVPLDPRNDALPLRVQFPAEPASVRPIRQHCRAAATSLGATREQIDAVALVSSEAASNVVRHAYPAEAPGAIELRLSSGGPGLLEIEITDRGVGVGNATSSGGLGQGLLLMSRLADSFDVVRPRRGGTVVTMRFRLG